MGSNAKLNVIHQNCQKSYKSFLQLKSNIANLNPDIVCIQEPYLGSNLDNLFSLNPTLYYHHSPSDPPYSVIQGVPKVRRIFFRTAVSQSILWVWQWCLTFMKAWLSSFLKHVWS